MSDLITPRRSDSTFVPKPRISTELRQRGRHAAQPQPALREVVTAVTRSLSRREGKHMQPLQTPRHVASSAKKLHQGPRHTASSVQHKSWRHEARQHELGIAAAEEAVEAYFAMQIAGEVPDSMHVGRPAVTISESLGARTRSGRIATVATLSAVAMVATGSVGGAMAEVAGVTERRAGVEQRQPTPLEAAFQRIDDIALASTRTSSSVLLAELNGYKTDAVRFAVSVDGIPTEIEVRRAHDLPSANNIQAYEITIDMNGQGYVLERRIFGAGGVQAYQLHSSRARLSDGHIDTEMMVMWLDEAASALTT